MNPGPDAKRERLEAWLKKIGGVMVAFSGGVDSAFLAAAAARTPGVRMMAATADSPSLPRRHLARARTLAEQFGFNHRIVATGELANPDYAANRGDRCYHCKNELFARLRALATEQGLAVVVDGSNADDAGDDRPGRRAAAEHGVRSPLAELGFTKADIRAASRRMGLPTADAPASACLASRVPPGTGVTAEILGRVERAEEALENMGFRQVRVRAHGDVARVELGADEINRLGDPALRARMGAAVRDAGFRFAAVDLDGYRMGSLNPPAGNAVGSGE